VCLHTIFLSMANYIPHRFCGMSIRVCASDDMQIILNALTGEEATVLRTAAMVSGRMFYALKFDEGGWAYLEGVGDDEKSFKMSYHDLYMTKQALQLPNGRIAIQDNLLAVSTYIDTKMGNKTHQTLKISPKESFSFLLFEVQRRIFESRMSSPHEMSARIFWEFRCLQPQLSLEVKDDTLLGWDKRNFRGCREMWEKWYQTAGGSAPSIFHFMPSRESLERTQMQDPLNL
jgi:hypothetical protein